MANKTTKSKICPECGAGNTYTKVSGVVVCRTCGWQSEEGAMLKMKGHAPAGPSRMSKWFQELTNTSFVNLNSFKSINATFEFISDIERDYAGIKIEQEIVKWREWHEDNNKTPKTWRTSLRTWLNKSKEGPVRNGSRKNEANIRITAGKPRDEDPFADL